MIALRGHLGLAGWICIAFADDDPVDCATVVLRQVTGGISLEESPHLPHVHARRVQLRVCRRVVQDQAMGGWRRRLPMAEAKNKSKAAGAKRDETNKLR